MDNSLLTFIKIIVKIASCESEAQHEAIKKMLPRDTITVSQEFYEAGTFNIIPYNGNKFTIIGWQISVDGGTLPTEKLKNNDKTFGYNWSADKASSLSPYVEVNIVSTSSVQFIKTSDNKSSQVLINYVPRDRILVPDPLYYEYLGASTTNGFSNGDILTNFFLFLIIVGLVFGFILKMVIKRK
mgnify:CR=1 FL=1